MKALLLVAHGSRLASSNDTVVELVQKLRPKLENYGFAGVEHAFLELTVPNIPQGIEALIAAGANEIVVLPYFLAPGTHVVDDMPELIEAARVAHPDILFTEMPYLGGVEGMIELILGSASLHRLKK